MYKTQVVHSLPPPLGPSAPLPGLGWSYINPTLVSPHHHSITALKQPQQRSCSFYIVAPGQWNFLAQLASYSLRLLRPFGPFALIFLSVQSGIQCLGDMLQAESAVSVTASGITPIFMFGSRGRSGPDGGSGGGALLVSLISFLLGLINQYSHNICQARTKTG